MATSGPPKSDDMMAWTLDELERAEGELEVKVADAKEGRDAAVVERLTHLVFAAQEDPEQDEPGGFWDGPDYYAMDSIDEAKDKAKIVIVAQVVAWYLGGTEPVIPEDNKHSKRLARRVGRNMIPGNGRVLHERLMDLPQIIFSKLEKMGRIEKSDDEKALAMVRGALAFKRAGA